MDHFELVSEYSPTGDQPQAIEKLVEGFKEGNQFQTLLGVTGSGKTFTMANVIRKLNKPTLIIAHNKTLAAQLYSEMKEFFPIMRWNTLSATMTTTNRRLTSRPRTHISRRIPPSTTRSISCVIQRRRRCRSVDVIIVASVSCIYGLGSPIDYKNMVISCARAWRRTATRSFTS